MTKIGYPINHSITVRRVKNADSTEGWISLSHSHSVAFSKLRAAGSIPAGRTISSICYWRSSLCPSVLILEQLRSFIE